MAPLKKSPQHMRCLLCEDEVCCLGLTSLWTLLLFYLCSYYVSLITGFHDGHKSVPLCVETHAINSWKETYICSATTTQALQDKWVSGNECQINTQSTCHRSVDNWIFYN